MQFKEKWTEEAIKKIPTGYRVLDAGAGELQFKKFCSHLNYVSQDFGQYDGVGNNSALQTNTWDQSKIDILSDITNIPEKDKSFDAIICTEVFEHIPNPVLAIKEFSRLLRKDGVLIITAPFCSLTHFAPFHFSTGFNRYFYEQHLVDHGFQITELTTNGNYFEYISQELDRIPWAAEHYSGTKLSLWYKILINILLKKLNGLSKKDTGSKELLCFGYHIFAKKIE